MKENVHREQRSRMFMQFSEKKMSLDIFHEIAQAFKLMNTEEKKELLASRIADEMENGFEREKLPQRAMEISKELSKYDPPAKQSCF